MKAGNPSSLCAGCRAPAPNRGNQDRPPRWHCHRQDAHRTAAQLRRTCWSGDKGCRCEWPSPARRSPATGSNVHHHMVAPSAGDNTVDQRSCPRPPRAGAPAGAAARGQNSWLRSSRSLAAMLRDVAAGLAAIPLKGYGQSRALPQRAHRSMRRHQRRRGLARLRTKPVSARTNTRSA